MKLILNLIGLLLLVSIFYCSNPAEHYQKPEVKTMEILQIDTAEVDTVLNEAGLFLTLDYIKGAQFLATWGNSPKYVSKDTIKILPSGNPHITMLKDKAIYIQQGCGTACFFGYMLPFNLNTDSKYYFYPFAVDLENNLIGFNGDNSNYLLMVENYLTGKREYIQENFCHSNFPGYCIDSIKFENKEIFIRWRDEQEKVVEKKFSFPNL